MDFCYELTPIGRVEILGSDGQVWTANVGLSVHEWHIGPPLLEVHYTTPDVRGCIRVIPERDVPAIVNGPDADEFDTLAKMALDLVEYPHPIATARDAARARKHATEALSLAVCR